MPAATKKTTRKTKTAEEMPVEAAEPKTRTKAKSVEAKTAKSSANALEIPVYGLDGKEVKTMTLSQEVFGVEESPRLVAQYVRVYLANQRQGTASTKSRGEIIGTTKKVYRQKGTGNARHGSEKAPIFVGGGVVGGPKPTDHSLKINKKQKRKALLSVLTSKVKEGAVAALGEDIVTMKPQTKSFATLLKTIGANDKKTLVVISEASVGLKLSVRNIENVETISTSNLNPYTLLAKRKILFTEEALAVLTSLYSKK